MRKKDSNFYGSRLRVARTFNGMTLAELGDAVATTRQYIQKLEVAEG